MKNCRECDREVYIHYTDYHYTMSGRQNIFIRDAKVYVCANCGEQGLVIQTLIGLIAEIALLPANITRSTYFAISHRGTWFRLPYKEGFQ